MFFLLRKTNQKINQIELQVCLKVPLMNPTVQFRTDRVITDGSFTPIVLDVPFRT